MAVGPSGNVRTDRPVRWSGATAPRTCSQARLRRPRRIRAERRSYSVPEDFAGVLGFGALFSAPPEAPESPEEGELDEELPSPVLGFDSDDDDEFPPDSLLSAFLRDSDG